MTKAAKPSRDQSNTPPVTRGRALTAQMAAEYLGVEVSTLSKWRSLGKGPRYSCALGRDPRYAVQDLEEFLWSPEKLVSNTLEAKHRRRTGTR